MQDMRKQQGTLSDSDSEDSALEEAELEGAIARKQERLRPTRERIARDRNVHRLRLKKLDKLPRDVLLEALQVRRLVARRGLEAEMHGGMNTGSQVLKADSDRMQVSRKTSTVETAVPVPAQ